MQYKLRAESSCCCCCCCQFTRLTMLPVQRSHSQMTLWRNSLHPNSCSMPWIIHGTQCDAAHWLKISDMKNPNLKHLPFHPAAPQQVPVYFPPPTPCPPSAGPSNSTDWCCPSIGSSSAQDATEVPYGTFATHSASRTLNWWLSFVQYWLRVFVIVVGWS